MIFSSPFPSMRMPPLPKEGSSRVSTCYRTLPIWPQALSECVIVSFLPTWN